MLEKALKAAIADARALAAQLGQADEATQAAGETVNEGEAELPCCQGIAPTQSAVDQCRELIKPEPPLPIKLVLSAQALTGRDA